MFGNKFISVFLLTVASVNANDLACFLETFNLRTADDSATVVDATFGPLLEGDLMASLPTLCGELTEVGTSAISCNIDGSDFYSDAVQICNDAGGQIVPQDLRFCGSDLEGQIDDVNNDGEDIPNIILSNIPLCMGPTCDPDTDVLAALQTLLDNPFFEIGDLLEGMEFLFSNGAACFAADTQAPTPAPNSKSDFPSTPSPATSAAAAPTYAIPGCIASLGAAVLAGF